jgi:hypothetical protein
MKVEALYFDTLKLDKPMTHHRHRPRRRALPTPKLTCVGLKLARFTWMLVGDAVSQNKRNGKINARCAPI